MNARWRHPVRSAAEGACPPIEEVVAPRPQRHGRRVPAAALFIPIVLAACDVGRPTPAATSSVAETAPAVLVHSRAPAADAFREAVEAALPGLVFVQVEGMPVRGWPGLAPGGSPLGDDPVATIPVSSGSGFVLDSAGLILTNNHVLQGAAAVTVVLSDKRRVHASVLGRDPDTDVAVLRVEATGLVPARLGDSDSLQVGDWVLAMGYPLGLSATVTAGIVSGIGRTLGLIAEAPDATAPLEYFIQTDAAINPGNSGGPLVDLAGRIVGINSAIASPSGYYTGYGFAIPINLARRVVEDLIRYGEVQRPVIGVRITDVTPADAQAFGLSAIAGAVIAGVVDGGPAAGAGIELGDVVVRVDSVPVATTGDLQATLARLRPGDRVSIHAVRYGTPVDFSLELARLPARARESSQSPVRPDPSGPGFDVIQDRRGLTVARVEPFSAAARAGIREGQRILALNRQPLRSLADYRAAINGATPPVVLSLRILDRTLGETIINVESGPAHRVR